MVTKEKFYSRILVSTVLVLFLILISSTASASDVDYNYTVEVSEEVQVTDSESDESCVAIDDNRIGWVDNSDENTSIRICDDTAGEEIIIPVEESASDLDICDDTAVWAESSSEESSIWMCDLSTEEVTKIATDKSASDPAIYEDRIAYTGRINGRSDIYVHDLSTQNDVQITLSGSAAKPAIHGKRIVYTDSRNGSSNIYMYDLLTSTETPITTSGSATNPAIYGNRVVWVDSSSGNWDIQMYDLSTSKVTQITADEFDQYDPDIYEDTIVWTDNRTGNLDVYMCIISEEDQTLLLPVANFTSNVTTGYVPLSVQFTDLSENADSVNWDFGDGATSIEQSPVHTYSAARTYTVNLTASNANGTNSTSATINVLKATPELTWNNPADIIYGTELSSTQLNASASVPGSFVYTPEAGTVLSAGMQTLNVEFTPDDAENYNTASKDVTINVLTPVQKIQQIAAIVQDLVTSGVLNKGQGNALIVKLNAAEKNLNKENTNAAINELNAFINQVNAYVKSEKLSPIKGQALINEANSVIDVLKTS